MKPTAQVLLVAAAALLLPAVATGCGAMPSATQVKAVDDGALVRRTAKAWHVIQSAHSGPVGFLKVMDVSEAGGPVFEWRYIYGADWTELGWVNQKGQAFQWEKYPPGAMPNPREPYRVKHLPMDSIQRNAMRMLGIDPALDDVTFPVASDADIRSAK